MLAHYVSYLVIVIFSPIFMSKSWFAAFLYPTIHMATAGWMFGVFSQINHLNEMSVETSKGATDNRLLRESWAARQVSTSQGSVELTIRSAQSCMIRISTAVLPAPGGPLTSTERLVTAPSTASS